MYQVQIISGHPNPKTAVFGVNADIMGPFQKIMIPQKSDLVKYSPLATHILERDTFKGGPKIYSRVDFTAHNAWPSNESETRISIRRGWEWNAEGRAQIGGILQQFFNSKTPALYIEAIQRDITPRPAFNPKGDKLAQVLMTAFETEVNPILMKDGGSMEVLGISYTEDAKIETELMLMGSCNGCSDSETKTLTGAFTRMREALNILKRDNPNNAALKKLEMAPFKLSQAPELVLAKA